MNRTDLTHAQITLVVNAETSTALMARLDDKILYLEREPKTAAVRAALKRWKSIQAAVQTATAADQLAAHAAGATPCPPDRQPDHF